MTRASGGSVYTRQAFCSIASVLSYFDLTLLAANRLQNDDIVVVLESMAHIKQALDCTVHGLLS